MAAADIENLLRASIGLNAASIGPLAIRRAVQERLEACHLDDVDAYWARVRDSSPELQELIEAVVVSETWFFRDRDSLATLGCLAYEAWQRRPDGMLSLLSLPCSTGEEPYSMAMALLDAAVPADRFRIDAIDISTRALALAAGAMYGRNSFRGHDLLFRDRHFEETATGHRLSETVRQQVRFHQGNLFAPDFLPGAGLYDVIFCRNVLIYFDRPTQDRAIGVLQRLLKPTGLLFVAPAETSLPISHNFVSTNLPMSFAFRRSANVPPEPKRPSVSVPKPAIRRDPPPVTAQLPLARLQSSVATRPQGALPTEKPGDIKEAMRLADQGHFVEAATSCAEHLRLHGPSAAAFCLMGLVRDATGNLQEAAGYYRKALYLEPNHDEAQIHLALLMEKQGDAAGAQILRHRARRVDERRKGGA